jgi:hypothetical protein
MSGAIPSLPQYDFMARCSVKKKHRDNFDFSLLMNADIFDMSLVIIKEETD